MHLLFSTVVDGLIIRENIFEKWGSSGSSGLRLDLELAPIVVVVDPLKLIGKVVWISDYVMASQVGSDCGKLD